MHSFTCQSQSQLQISKFNEITKPSIPLNLNYQLIYFIKSIHCITKESNNQNRKPNKNKYIFLEFSLGENLSWARTPRLRENYLAWTKTVQKTHLLQGHSHLGDYTLAWVKLDPRAPLKFPSDFAWARLPSLGEKCRKTSSIQYLRVNMHALDDQNNKN